MSIVRNLVSAIALAATLGACSTNGGMYSESDPANNEFSGWKTAGAVVLGVLTLGAVGAGAYAGASQPTYRPVYTPTYTSTYSHSETRTYMINGELITCNRVGSYVNCF
jgi:hypothetical protein